MNVLKEIQAIWRLDDKEQMETRMSSLSTPLETGILEKKELQDIVHFLLEKGIEEPDQSLQTAIFNLASYAIFDQKIGPDIDWSNLIRYLPFLHGEALIYSIDFLAASGKKEYIPILEPYTHSPKRNVRGPAIEAIRYLQQN
jgi:hypothetical protein